MKTVRHGVVPVLALCILASVAAWAEPTETATGHSPKVLWRVDAGFSGAWVPSWEDERPFLSAAGLGIDTGIEASWQNWIVGRIGLALYSVSRSNLDANLFLYRPFWGWRLALETGGFISMGKADLALLAGGSFSTYEFTGTSLVGAYWSALCEIRLQLPVFIRGLSGFKVDAGFPFEYMWRGAAQSYSLGLSIGGSIPLGKGKQ